MSGFSFGSNYVSAHHDDDDSSAPRLDLGSWLWSASHSGVTTLNFDGFAKGGPGGGGGGSGGGGSTSKYVSGGGAENYNIEVIFKGTWTDALKQTFIDSADQISKYIIGDVQDVLYHGKIIDDLSITAELVTIDGIGGILGQAGPNAVRTGSYLPAAGTMQFDIADADYYQAQNLFNDIVFHEMMHTVGFGTIWSYKGLISNHTFVGQQAEAAYGGAPIPLETGYGSGTDDAHWDEQIFTNEIMTGFINNDGVATNPDGTPDSDNYLSYMSVASLGDLGYTLTGATYAPPLFI